MTSTLTLTVDKSVIEAAKAYATKNGKSVSELVENYLKFLAGKENEADEFSPGVKRLLGSVNLPEEFDYKKSLEEELTKKYRQ